jgi:hypothetical protein
MNSVKGHFWLKWPLELGPIIPELGNNPNLGMRNRLTIPGKSMGASQQTTG